MEQTKLNYETSTNIISQIQEYISKINTSITKLDDKFSKLTTDNAWNSNNAYELQNKGLNIIKKFKIEISDLNATINQLNTNLIKYENLEQKVIGALEGTNKI